MAMVSRLTNGRTPIRQKGPFDNRWQRSTKRSKMWPEIVRQNGKIKLAPPGMDEGNACSLKFSFFWGGASSKDVRKRSAKYLIVKLRIEWEGVRSGQKKKRLPWDALKKALGEPLSFSEHLPGLGHEKRSLREF